MDATFWLILTFCLGIVGAVFYLILRRDKVVKFKRRERGLVSLSDRYQHYEETLIGNKRKNIERIYNDGINYVIKTDKFREKPLEEIVIILQKIKDDESIIYEYIEGAMKNNENYKRGVIQGFKILLDRKKFGKSTI